jgi:hypothetical protein
MCKTTVKLCQFKDDGRKPLAGVEASGVHQAQANWTITQSGQRGR